MTVTFNGLNTDDSLSLSLISAVLGFSALVLVLDDADFAACSTHLACDAFLVWF